MEDSPPPAPADDGAAPGKRLRLLEDLFILVCILALWPVVLGWQHPVYEVILYIALAGLVFIFYRRINRFRDARREAEGGATDGN